MAKYVNKLKKEVIDHVLLNARITKKHLINGEN